MQINYYQLQKAKKEEEKQNKKCNWYLIQNNYWIKNLKTKLIIKTLFKIKKKIAPNTATYEFNCAPQINI